MSDPPSAPPPTIPEAEDPLADIFADIRAVMRVPVAPLVYRRIAAFPGCLEWSWARLRSLYASPVLEALGAELSSGIELPPLPRHGMTDLAAAGVDAAGVAAIRATLSAFQRSNPKHLIALTALLTELSNAMAGIEGTEGREGPTTPGTRAEGPRPQGNPTAPPRLDLIPTMLAEEDLDAPTAALAWQLAALGGKNTPPALPSIWGILAHWPGYLELALHRLKPLEEDGWLAASTARLEIQVLPAAEKAMSLLGAIPEPPMKSAPPLDSLREVLRQFTSSVILRIIPLLIVLGATLPESPSRRESGGESNSNPPPIL